MAAAFMDAYASPYASSMPISYPRAVNVARVGSSTPSIASNLNSWVQKLVNLNQGSAGRDTSDEYVLSSDGFEISIELPAKHERDIVAAEPLDLCERLNSIKETLGLSVTQIAELFNVTRKSVYDWYDGVEPRSSKINRIETLVDILQSAPREIDLRRVKFVWNIPTNGVSFLSLLNDDRLDSLVLKTKLSSKLYELAPRLAKKEVSELSRLPTFGDASLAEFDRIADLS